MQFPDRWDTIDYLARGTPRQRAAHSALEAAGVMQGLAPWGPLLAGTIPLGIDVEGSDLDILCEVYQFGPFLAQLQERFGHLPGYEARQKEIGSLPTVVARFHSSAFLVEVFAQPRPVAAQNGYRHMLIEARLLKLAGPGAAAAVHELKARGMKTEPAFARYFGLSGDPYQALLDLAEAGEETIRATARKGGG